MVYEVARNSLTLSITYFSQVSLLASLDPAKHFEIGRLLAPFLDQGYAIVGSGQITHNMRVMMRGGTPAVLGNIHAFYEWFKHTATDEVLSDEERRKVGGHLTHALSLSYVIFYPGFSLSFSPVISLFSSQFSLLSALFSSDSLPPYPSLI